MSLRIVKDYFLKSNVVDFGCVDGPFLPSLSIYFNKVIAIDRNPQYLRIGEILKEVMNLNNVTIINNQGISFEDLREILNPNELDIIFLLWVFE
jgi:predicted RNA methylase